MANYYGSARSNRFRVKDVDAIVEAFGPYEVEVFVDDAAESIVTLLARDSDGAGWPTFVYVEEPEDSPDDFEEYVEIDYPALIAPHLAEGSVAILFEAGAEKLRYLVGTAWAINAAGETRSISLDQMFETAKEIGPEVLSW